MTIYIDAGGNRFLGDCIYSTHDITNPTKKYLKAHSHTSISSELNSLFSSSGLKYRNILSQSQFNNTGVISSSLFSFAANSDTIDDRYTVSVSRIYNSSFSGSTSIKGLQMYNDTGYSQTNNSVNSTNVILDYGFNVLASESITTPSGSPTESLGFSTNYDISWVANSDGESLAIFLYQYDFVLDKVACKFYYLGLLKNVNPGYSYYNQNIITQSVLLSSIGNGSNGYVNSSGCTVGGCHYINNQPKLLLKTLDAQYPIVCSNSQLPTPDWATDFLVFDNNNTLGSPCIGKVRNLLLSTSPNLVIGKPVYIRGYSTEGLGSRWYLPVGTFAGKNVLMRCYSSVIV